VTIAGTTTGATITEGTTILDHDAITSNNYNRSIFERFFYACSSGTGLFQSQPNTLIAYFIFIFTFEIRLKLRKMESWATKMIAETDGKLKGIRDKDIRFYRIEEFKRNIKRVDTFSATCPYCAKEKANISDATQKIDEAIKVPGRSRREYDRLISRLSTHMHKQHGFITPYYYTYLFSFFGMVAGLLTGYILQKLIPAYNWEMLMAGFVSGLLPGYFIGSFRDKKVRTQKKLM
jgi:hypothetical protein